ncbi:MAG: TonB family protein [Bacteroidales bacterium]|nr:TonB family protein [Bacteroidales bacterium]
MEIKKNPQADIEKDKVTYFLLGLIVTLSTLFVLLEWRTEKANPIDWNELPTVFIEEEYSGFIEQPVLPEQDDIIPLIEEKPQITYEDYNIVEEPEPAPSALPGLIESLPEISENTFTESDLTEELQEEPIYNDPQTKPEFPGGFQALSRFLFTNIQYPASARTQRIQGRVWCSFVVNKDGSVSDVKVERGIHISLDQEASKVLKKMPPWTPGTINGQPVRVKVFVPVVFKL